MTTATAFCTALRAALAGCIDAAREQGWWGEPTDYVYTGEDLDSVVEAVGRKPTVEEWASVGLCVGAAHVSKETYLLHHAGRPLFGDADAYHVGGEGGFCDLESAIEAAESLDACGWNMDVVRLYGVSRTVVWG